MSTTFPPRCSLSEKKTLPPFAVSPDSSRPPIYHATLNQQALYQSLIDSGASTNISPKNSQNASLRRLAISSLRYPTRPVLVANQRKSKSTAPLRSLYNSTASLRDKSRPTPSPRENRSHHWFTLAHQEPPARGLAPECL